MLKGDASVTKLSLEQAIVEHGGEYAQAVKQDKNSDPRIVIAAKWEGCTCLLRCVGNHSRDAHLMFAVDGCTAIKSKANISEVDVLSAGWVLDSIKQGRLLPKTKQYVSLPYGCYRVRANKSAVAGTTCA